MFYDKLKQALNKCGFNNSNYFVIVHPLIYKRYFVQLENKLLMNRYYKYKYLYFYFKFINVIKDGLRRIK
jgi:hypothetical protein